MKKQKKTPIFLLLLMILSLGGFGFASYKVISQKVEDNKGINVYESIENMVLIDGEKKKISLPLDTMKDSKEVEVNIIDFDFLRNYNGDICAWLELPDTIINYPVVQAENNDKYLRHLLNGEYHRFGTLFFDYRNDLSDNQLNDDISYIYGHNIRAGDMFHTLSFYTEQSFYDEHPYMLLYMKDKVYKVELFSMVIINKNDEMPFRFTDTFLDTIIGKSLFKSNVSVSAEDKILAMFTCTNENEDERYILYGKCILLEE